MPIGITILRRFFGDVPILALALLPKPTSDEAEIHYHPHDVLTSVVTASSKIATRSPLFTFVA
jgi:hypothetical protein